MRETQIKIMYMRLALLAWPKIMYRPKQHEIQYRFALSFYLQTQPLFTHLKVIYINENHVYEE